jgi:hypothetical protein
MPPPGCPRGYRQAANGCSACGPGTYQGEEDYMFSDCTVCEPGKYMDVEGASACIDCYKPVCAKAIEYCNPISGLEQNFSYYDPFEAINVVCGETDIVGDPCAAPFHCVAGECTRGAALLPSPPSPPPAPFGCWALRIPSLPTNLSRYSPANPIPSPIAHTKRRGRHSTACISGAAQCSSEPARYPMRLLGLHGNNGTLGPPDWGAIGTCPSLHGDVDSAYAYPACWDQYTDVETISGWSRSKQLLYSSDKDQLTAMVGAPPAHLLPAADKRPRARPPRCPRSPEGARDRSPPDCVSYSPPDCVSYS